MCNFGECVPFICQLVSLAYVLTGKSCIFGGKNWVYAITSFLRMLGSLSQGLYYGDKSQKQLIRQILQSMLMFCFLHRQAKEWMQ